MESPGQLIRRTRTEAGLTQERLALRAGTTSRHVGRIERGEVSPTVETLARLLAAMGRRLELGAALGPPGNQSEAELLADARQSAQQRIGQVAALSRTLTGVAAASGRR